MELLRKNILLLENEEDIRTINLKCRVDEHKLIVTITSGEDTSILICQDVDLLLFDVHMPELGQGASIDLIQQYDPALNIVIIGIYPHNDLEYALTNRLKF